MLKTEQLMEMSPEELIDHMAGGEPGSPSWEKKRAVLDWRIAKLNAQAASNLARLTMWLMIATAVMAAATIVLAVAALT